MKKFILGFLIVGNIVFALLFISALNPGHARQLRLSDLKYGEMDTNGDGICGPEDDYIVKWLVEHNPKHLEDALKLAEIRNDGSVDLSAHLMTFRGR